MVYSDPPHNMPVEHLSLTQQVENTFQSVSGLVRASIQPLPTQTGDGTYITPPPSTGVLQDLLKIGPQDLKTIIESAKADLFGTATDDRKYLLEHVIDVCTLKSNDECSTDIFPLLVGPQTSLVIEKWQKTDGCFHQWPVERPFTSPTSVSQLSNCRHKV